MFFAFTYLVQKKRQKSSSPSGDDRSRSPSPQAEDTKKGKRSKGNKQLEESVELLETNEKDFYRWYPPNQYPVSIEIYLIFSREQVDASDPHRQGLKQSISTMKKVPSFALISSRR